MQTNLIGRTVVITNDNQKAEIVAVEMKQAQNCFLVLTLLFADRTLKTVVERDVTLEND